MITFCLTSCERPDLLKRTLASFLKYNTYPISAYYVSEDSSIRMHALENEYPFIKFLYNDSGKRYGMMPNIQKVYSCVTTEYIFHCEEDWEFYRSGFIEKSMPILEARKDILQVWIRELNDTNGHPISQTINNISGVDFRFVETGYMNCFHGYSCNPGLRRKKDVANFIDIIGDCKNNGENLVSQYYFEKGFRSVILTGGYVNHIGYNRTVI